ncbi:hypothetical protein [Pseudomonas sp.]|jgi:hypothetical protein|uniref:hypothetical protein n=1 Tax=Pseudomonas sp. TaxID=306 RepID=UPI001F404C4F
MTLSLADKIFLASGILEFSGIIICLGTALHMAYTQMDLILAHLKNCPAVVSQIPLRNGGPWGKLLLTGWIAGIVTFPGYYLKHGGVSVEDLQNLPLPLKRKLVTLKWASIVLLAGLVILFAFRKTGILK